MVVHRMLHEVLGSTNMCYACFSFVLRLIDSYLLTKCIRSCATLKRKDPLCIITLYSNTFIIRMCLVFSNLTLLA
jgi:hypothetical protein